MALSKIDVSKMITGVTPLTNGGTGGTSIPATNLASGVTGTLPVGSGGTGLTSGTTDQLLKFTGSTTLASSAISTGKVKQIVNASLGSTINTNSNSASNVLQLSFTPTSASTVVAVFCSVGYQLYGNVSSSNPGGNFIIRKEIGGSGSDITSVYCDTNGVLNSTSAYISIPGNLNGIFTPGATTQCDIYLRFKTNGNGRIQAFGNAEGGQDNPTRLIAMEYST